MNETPASDQEIADAIRQFHEARAESGDLAAQALSSVSADEGIVKVVYDASLASRHPRLALRALDREPRRVRLHPARPSDAGVDAHAHVDGPRRD